MLVSLASQVSKGRRLYFEGVLKVGRGGFDLMLAEYPDGLRVPGVFDPKHHIPRWNSSQETFLKTIVEFAFKYLHDGGAIVIFYPDSYLVRRKIETYTANFNIKIALECNILNSLLLCSPSQPSSSVSFDFGCNIFTWCL